jgi:hypothetical protein
LYEVKGLGFFTGVGASFFSILGGVFGLLGGVFSLGGVGSLSGVTGLLGGVFGLGLHYSSWASKTSFIIFLVQYLHGTKQLAS